MKNIKLSHSISIFLIVGSLCLNSCNDEIVDFGFDGQISGTILDDNGNPVSGDRKLATFAVHALGEEDITSMVMRINHDGTYANTKLYPQSYKVWLIGPFIGGKTDTVIVDLTRDKTVVKDFQVTPLLSLSAPVVNGTPSSSEIKVDYNITGNGGNSPNLREIYCSTVSWPTRTTGTGIGYFTKNVTVTDNIGTATISGLQPNTKYFIRIGARATGQSLFNHSEQISVNTATK